MSFVLVIFGATATGKSEIALELANIFNGEIINADSLQVYQGLKIITAVPDIKSLDTVPHHLYSILNPSYQRCSAGQWLEMSNKKINEVISRNKLPIVVGGTGLYIDVLLNGINEIPEVSPEIYQEVSSRFKLLGKEKFWEDLIIFDQQIVGKINQPDSQRMQRAYAVKLATGKSIFDWWRTESVKSSHHFITVFINYSRECLYEFCNMRLLKMVDQGVVAEIDEFCKKYSKDAVDIVKKAVGFSEILQYLAGNIDLDEMIGLSQLRTRQYAKRQVTWFKNKTTPDIILDDQDSTKNLLKVRQELQNILAS